MKEIFHRKKIFNRNEIDLTTGNLFLKMPLFVIPLAMTTIFQLLYTTIDLWTVSQFGGGSTSMAAIGSNSALINMIITVLVSLATGSNVAISAAKGADDQAWATKILHTAFVVAVQGGILVAIFGFFMSGIFLQWMDTPAGILTKATEYLKIYFLGIPLLMIYNFGSQMMRALGDSRRPLLILIISGVVNVIFDFVFVRYVGLDVKGVAIATVISEAVSATLTVLFFLFNKNGFVWLDFRKLRVDMKALKEICRIGLPAGIQGLAFCIPNVMIQSSLYTITDYAINGISISQDEIVVGAAASSQIEGYIFAVLDSFAVGSISFVGQNYGAKNEKNIKRVYLYAVIWMASFWALCALISGLFPYALLSIFITESEGVVVNNALAAGRERLYILAFTYGFDGLMDINGNYLRGMKISTPPAIITLIGCTGTRFVFLLTIFKLSMFHTIFWLYAVFPISWILVNFVYIPVILHYQKKVFASFRRQDDTIQHSVTC